ncbi:MAG: hypothetical protein FWE92_04760 [Defluviitaleaceae bacterium]|nr:hypothetical protein [Defluviitaleaceae bacterium]
MITTLKLIIILAAALLMTACSNRFSHSSDTDRVPALFQSILLNERTFSTQWPGHVYLDDYRHYSYYAAREIAVVYMDGNGVPEIIIKFLPSHCKLVLHYYNGEVFGSGFGVRSMNMIKTDGTFMMSGGGWSGIGKLTFDGQESDVVIIDIVEPVQVDYPNGTWVNALNGREISDEELSAWFDAQHAKEDVIWQPFTGDFSFFDDWRNY